MVEIFQGRNTRFGIRFTIKMLGDLCAQRMH
jgi:hypothetical protein